MEKECEICKKIFTIKDKGYTRKYCYECSPSYSKNDSKDRSKAISALRRAMKIQAIQELGGKCMRCGYNKCIDALIFHHTDPSEKEFGLAQNGKCHSWQEYLNEAKKCKLLCANCHAEEHFRLNEELRQGGTDI